MCFSATASFAAAAATGAIGVFVLARTQQARDLPLAAMPLFFAAQQFVEGGLWLTLPVAPESAVTSWLTHTFLAFALVFWPVFAPAAALSAEDEAWRRPPMFILLALGVGVAAYFLWTVQLGVHEARIVGGHIDYDIGTTPDTVAFFYLIATTTALLLSSRPAVALFGALVFTGSLITYLFYAQALISVWCFFAAAGSVVIAVHFERVRAHRLALAAEKPS